jgi:uncharacterized membrane protein
VSYYPTRRGLLRSVAIGQGIIALFIAINLFVPTEYRGYITTAYFIVFIAIFSYSTFRQRPRGALTRDIVSGRRLLTIKQEEVSGLQTKDLELVNELKPLLKASGLSILSMVVIMLWFFLYPTLVRPHITSLSSSNSVLMQVTDLLILYEVPVVISLTTQLLSRKILRRYLNILRSAEIYTTGIVGLPGFALKFPVENYSVRVNYTRKFVEFVRKEGRIEILHRIYYSDPERLADIISRYGKVRVERYP